MSYGDGTWYMDSTLEGLKKNKQLIQLKVDRRKDLSIVDF